jgi:hypothetical protein
MEVEEEEHLGKTPALSVRYKLLVVVEMAR